MRDALAQIIRAYRNDPYLYRATYVQGYLHAVQHNAIMTNDLRTYHQVNRIWEMLP